MSVPPPPPPEPPKMEIKGEPAARPAKPSAKEEPKAAAKEPQSSKGKSAKDTLSKLFRQKVNKQLQTADYTIQSLLYRTAARAHAAGRSVKRAVCEFEVLLGVKASKSKWSQSLGRDCSSATVKYPIPQTDRGSSVTN